MTRAVWLASVFRSRTGTDWLACSAWRSNNQFTAINLIDGNYQNYEVRPYSDSLGGESGNRRAYMTWGLDEAYQMDFGVLSSALEGAAPSNWEIYTSNDPNAFAGLDGLSAATPLALDGLGWTLQYQQGAASSREQIFAFDQPGEYRYLLLVLNGQNNPVTQLEVFAKAVPEPATMGLLVLGGLAMLRRRKR